MMRAEPNDEASQTKRSIDIYQTTKRRLILVKALDSEGMLDHLDQEEMECTDLKRAYNNAQNLSKTNNEIRTRIAHFNYKKILSLPDDILHARKHGGPWTGPQTSSTAARTNVAGAPSSYPEPALKLFVRIVPLKDAAAGSYTMQTQPEDWPTETRM
ncbi:hypothetical protein WG66_008451 [Moniliophthora roreri]|nr:hypothetical protein WG66_008451 [Moniliophthora roreri]